MQFPKRFELLLHIVNYQASGNLNSRYRDSLFCTLMKSFIALYVWFLNISYQS